MNGYVLDCELEFASTFAGIGGFDKAFEEEGLKCVYQVEINPERRKVLARHWPNVPRGDDVKLVRATDLGRPDVLVGGFPCKNLSIGKGKRTGLQSEDSGLYWEFQRLVGEHLRLVDSARPRWTVLENVPGLLSFNDGRDMAAVLLGLEDLGYGWAYRVVDAHRVGSAQRRPRVIIVGHRGGDPRPAWSVLADTNPGQRVAEIRREPAGNVGSELRRGLAAGCRIWRKSSRPRAKAELGGWASYVESEYSNTLTNNDSGSNLRQTHVVYQDGRLRALTPVEWERLQGFPDGWTAGIPDRDRQLALGDAMNVDLARWLARRLIAVDREVPLLQTELTR